MNSIQQLILILALMGCACGQTYSARTDLTPQPYPVSIPCPGPSCGSGGALLGANFQFTPPDFAIPIVRVTDVNTGGQSVQHSGYKTSCDSSSEVNPWNLNHDRVSICQNGNFQQLWSFNSTTLTFARSTSFLSPGSGTMFFSFTQPYIAYHAHLNGSNDLAIFSYDTTCGSGIATCNPTPVQVVDIGTVSAIGCLIANASAGAAEGITVSADDQTFVLDATCTPGQSSSGNHYVVSWNRANGICFWDTGTGTVSGSGCSSPGSIGISDTFLLHNVRLGKGGMWAKVQLGSCTGSCTAGVNNYFWQVGTHTVTLATAANSCGHSAVGYTHWVNKCAGAEPNGLFISTFTSPNSQTSLPSAYPSPDHANDTHLSWANDNSADTNPFFAILEWTSFVPADTWDNEILGVATDGSGKVWRFAHTYETPVVNPFSTTSISQDGKYLLWTTDWNMGVGNVNGVLQTCTGFSDCRTDVFLAVLPILPLGTGTTSMGGGVSISGGVTMH